MNVSGLTSVAAAIARTSPGTAAQVAAEFDALLLQMLWRSAGVPGGESSSSQLHSVFGDFFAQQLARHHSAGFGALVLRSVDNGG